MYDRIERIKKRVVIDHYPICIQKFRITLEAREKYKNLPPVVQRGKILEEVAANMPIAIAPDELIVGMAASKPMGLEIDPDYGVWEQSEIDSLKEDGYLIDPEDERLLQELNKSHDPATLIGQMGNIIYENERLISALEAGLILPPWKNKKSGKGVGGGYAQSGLGLGPSLILLCVDYAKLLNTGTDAMIRQAEDEMAKLRFLGSKETIEKFRYYQGVISSLRAMNILAERYAALAARMAREEADPARRAELEQIAAICRRVPAKPASSFREAMQAFWFTILMLSPSTTLPGGRFDQFMYPFYEKDLAEGRITRDEALELICLLRLKDMELNRTSGKNNRKKNAGMAKWHNYTIGGVKPNGSDATNEITYLVLESAAITKTPHFTITLRVHEKTPEALMHKALEVVRMGLGMPAFVGDESYIKTFTSRGVPIEDAREYVMTGCLDANLPGKSRTGPVPMVTIPLIFDIFRHNGTDVTTGNHCGIETGDFTAFTSYDELYAAFLRQVDYLLDVVAEKNNIELFTTRELLPDPLRSALMYEGIECGHEVFDRVMPFENGAVVNPIGMINTGDILAAMKKLVFDEKKYTLSQLYDALEADWEGYKEMRRDFEAAPKYGNNDDYVDAITARWFRDFCDMVDSKSSIYGHPHIPTGISITSHQPGGELTGATPDGRKAHEILADGSVSPMHSMDTRGPTAVFQSAMKIDQDPFQATLMNMKFSPTALRTDADLAKLGAMIRVYLTHGGKHVQFNVVDRATLRAAQENPHEYRDLVVRIAGYSAYFVQLNRQMQDEVIERVEQAL